MIRRRLSGFTLVELMTVAFIIAVMVAVLLPAIQKFRADAQKGRTRHIIEAIRMGLSNYADAHGNQLPPSEPDKTGSVSYTSYKQWGAKALLYYLNGSDGKGLQISDGGQTKIEPPRVDGPMKTGAGFLDAWGNTIEYVVAYQGRAAWLRGGWPRNPPGQVTADVFPRAVNVSLSGSGDYSYEEQCGSETFRAGGYVIRVKVASWLDGWPYYYCGNSNHPRAGGDEKDSACPTCSKARELLCREWPYHSVPVNNTNAILVSPGSDALFGTADDVGDVEEEW